MTKKNILIIGGARSGKSSFGIRLAMGLGRRIAFIATAEGLDDDMKRRIKRHRQKRPREVATIEEPLKLSQALKRAGREFDCIVIDCLTLWLSNILKKSDRAIEREIAGFINALRSIRRNVIIISNEVGMGVVPANRSARRFRDILGGLNQAVASEAETVILMMSGIPVVIKGKEDI